MNTIVRVISLISASERRAQFRQSAEGAAIEFEFFDAHREAAPFLLNDVAAQRRILGSPLEPAEVGCYSSHVTAWVEFLASEASQLIVLEDDVVVDWPFIAYCSGFNFEASGINYLRLFAKIYSPKRRLKTSFLTTYHSLFQNLDLALGTQAYILSRNGANQLLDHCRVIRRPIDEEMDRSWAHGLPNLELVPSPVFERFTPSSIGDRRLERRRTSRYRWPRIIAKCRKISYRILLRREMIDFPPRWESDVGCGV